MSIERILPDIEAVIDAFDLPLEVIQRSIEPIISGRADATDTVIPSADTLVVVDGEDVVEIPDRSRYRRGQTPQTFRVSVLRQALKAVRDRGQLVTDDTAACELIGQPVRLVECPAPNPKATSPADLPYLAALLQTSAAHRG